MIKKVFLFFITVIIASFQSGYAQIEWIDTICDLGVINESDGPKEGRVTIINHNDKPTFIRKVKPGCGCTAVSYSENLIEPGDSAEIILSFNPAGRPGKIDKKVKVYIGSDGEMEEISLIGNVIPTLETLSLLYPFRIENLRLENSRLDFGEITKGNVRHRFLNLYNAGNDTLFLNIETGVKSLEGKISIPIIPPGETSSLSLCFDSSEENFFGPREYSPKLTVSKANGEKETGEISVKVKVAPGMPKIRKENPHIIVHPKFIDLGENVGNGKSDFSFHIANDGDNELTVYNIFTQSPIVSMEEYGNGEHPVIIKPGEKLQCKGFIDASLIEEGPFRIGISIYNDDPINSNTEAYLIGIKHSNED